MTSSIQCTVEEALLSVGNQEPDVIFLGKPTNKLMGKRVKRVCPVCGKTDYVTPHDAKTKRYCSAKCGHVNAGVAKTARTSKVKWTCGYCGKVEYLTPYWARTKKHCSRKCRGMASQSIHSAERKSLRNSTEWRKIRKKRVLQFCGVCPITLETKPLHVHHIDFDFSNHDEDNLIPLWTPYHTLVHARAGYAPFYEALDRAVLSFIVRFWNENGV